MKKSKKVFEMNDDYAEFDELDTLGLAEVDKLIYNEVMEEPLAASLSQPEPPDRSGLEAQVDEVVQEISGAKSGGQVYLVDVQGLEPYPDQPFRQYPLERLQELAEDIGRVGILSPILTRRHGARLQILAGHNRWAAAKLAGLTEVPVMVLDADDDRAILVLTSTNLRQREKLLPSEKAFAYKMQMEALKRQGQRSEGGYDASSFITQQTGDSRMQIHRFVRLTELEPGLLELLDKGRISMTPAVAVSYLHPDSQRHVLEVVRQFGVSLTIERANALKGLAGGLDGARLDDAQVDQVLLGGKKRKEKEPQEEYVRLRFDRIRAYLPRGCNEDMAEAIIVEALLGMRRENG